MRTAELTGAALDWAVAKCKTENPYKIGRLVYWPNENGDYEPFRPSTDWSQGGPIIERECISILSKSRVNPDEWIATYNNPWIKGETPLIAAMRCYVANKLGDTVEVPPELF